MNQIQAVEPRVPRQLLCRALSFPRATFYRMAYPKPVLQVIRIPRVPPLALNAFEEQIVLDILHNPEFMDQAPDTIYATLLERGIYSCSVRTMYRILDKHSELKERRNQLKHPHYAAPELIATGPNQVWSWDITKLKGPVKWTYFYLYVLLDIFSRYVVGWLIADTECSTLGQQLIGESFHKHHLKPGMLFVHSDRGPSMKSKSTTQFLADLGVTKTHSRPHVSNDNPFSESHFKTYKSRPNFPNRFGAIEDGRGFTRDFMDWYNNEHKHSGIAYLTPAEVHFGLAPQILALRQETLDRAFQANPSRFKGRQPMVQQLPEAVWINPPADQKLRESDRIQEKADQAKLIILAEKKEGEVLA